MNRIFTFLLLQFAAVFAVAQTTNVTFSVDMTNYGSPFTTVYVSGEFNGWNGTANPLVNTSGDIWEATIAMNENLFYDYKFTIDDWAAQESFAGGTWCATNNGGFVNRVLWVGEDDMIEPTVCWDACVACGASEPTGTRMVTFSLDMNGYSGSFTTPEVNGTFNGWCGNCNQLTDMGNGIWETTLPLAVGQHEFKFATDNWTDQENFTAGDVCTVTNGGFTNRFLNVGNADTTLGDTILTTYAWDDCYERCATPENLRYKDLQDQSATLVWDPIANAEGYRILYKVAGAGSWNVDWKYSNVGQKNIAGLTASTIYKWTIQSNCALNRSPLAVRARFVTLSGPCANPDSMWTNPVGGSQAKLNWTNPGGVTKYKVRWRQMGAGNWSEVTKDGTKTHHWINISPLTTYEWQIKSICEKGDAPGNVWSASSVFGISPKQGMEYALATGAENPFVNVFPNPATSRLNIAMQLEKDFNGMLLFTDATGRLVRSMDLDRSAGAYTDVLDLDGLAPGMYILHMQDADFRYMERIIIR